MQAKFDTKPGGKTNDAPRCAFIIAVENKDGLK